jgi:Tfp pilus assembly PilM family ATPase
MATRTSFELYPGGCRMVEVELPGRRGRTATPADVRVKQFVTEIPGGDDQIALADYLSRYRQEQKLGKEAWVTIWGLRTAHQFLRLPPAKPGDLEMLARREARKDITPLEADGDPASVAVVMGAEVPVGQQRRREVSLVATSATEVRRRIQPFVDAGFVVDGVLTPALALTTIARSHRDGLPGTAAAYVALTSRATCLAIIRDGVLLFVREMAWGHQNDAGPASHDDLGVRLASEVRRSVLFFKQTFRASVDGVVLCGDMPNMRVLTGPLAEALSVPVQTLDSLVGIDAAAVPEPAEQFRSNVAALRLAIAAGADTAPAANLLPSTIRVSRAARAEVIRLAGTAAASLAIVMGAFVFAQRSASGYERERQESAQQIAQLEPEARRLDELRQAVTLAAAQQAALGAFDSQGPRFARLLEAVSQATPDAIVMTSITASAEGTNWRATINGIAVTDDAASGQAAVNALIKALSDSPYVGTPVQPPSLRVVSGTGGAGATSGTDQHVAIPEGMSGVEFELQFELPR